MSIQVVFVQPNLRSYRAALFSRLTEELGWKIYVVHSGIDESCDRALFDSTKVPCAKVGSLMLQSGLAYVMKTADVNVVTFDLHWPIGLWYGFLGQSHRPLVLWGHGFGRSEVASKVRTWLMKKADQTIFYGYRGQEEALTRGVPGRKTVVAPNTMVIANHENMSAQEKSYFLYVGRLQARKRLDLLIEAFALFLQHRGNRAQLVLVGDGDIREELQNLASYLGIRNSVRFRPGTIDEEKLRRWFKKAIAYVSPGPVGLGVLHAFAYGVPVLTMKGMPHGPEAEWIRDGVSGIFSETNVEAFAEAMCMLCDSDRKSIEMGRAAYSTYRDVASPKQMVEGFRLAIEGALSDRA